MKTFQEYLEKDEQLAQDLYDYNLYMNTWAMFEIVQKEAYEEGVEDGKTIHAHGSTSYIE